MAALGILERSYMHYPVNGLAVTLGFAQRRAGELEDEVDGKDDCEAWLLNQGRQLESGNVLLRRKRPRPR